MSTGLQVLELLAGYLVCGLIGLFALLALYRIYQNDKSGLEFLISEKDGTGASMSRFQLLVFTFVVSLSLFLIVVSHAKLAQTREYAAHPDSPNSAQLPDVPGGILALLGISASSYTVSKAIQTNIAKPPDIPKTQV
jgi:hypothetical protein